MSDGPIKREREAWKPSNISTPDAKRICFRLKSTGPGYCGRTSTKTYTPDWAETTCTDCRAGGRADGVNIPLNPARNAA